MSDTKSIDREAGVAMAGGGDNGKLVLVTGRSNSNLAENIAHSIGHRLTSCDVSNFSDGEIFVQVKENVRGMDAFLIQSTSSPVNDHLMELLIITDALKRASAKRITAVIPYFGYARQDRKVQSRTPITAKLVADLISAAGIDRVLTVDLHAGQIQGFFNMPVDHLYAAPILIGYIQKLKLDNLVVFSPDAGGVERARAYAKHLGAQLGIIDKRRDSTKKNVAKAMNIIGEAEGKNVVIIDDMVDTAGTLAEAAGAIMDAGAKSVRACCSHAVLSGPAVERINNSRIAELIVTNSIDLKDKQAASKKLTVLDLAPLLADAIHRIHSETSVSSLFEY